MNIVYASSEYYYHPTYVSIFSLLKNSVDKHNVVLLSSGIPQKKVNELEAMVLRFGSTFDCLDIKDLLEAKAKKYNFPLMRGGYSTYARIFLADILLDLEDVLLIDSDTLVLGDVSEIKTAGLENVMLACRDYVVSNKYSNHEAPALASTPYYNMGVVYVNLKKWRDLKLTDLLDKDFDRKYQLKIADQSIVNKYFSDYISPLEIKFNFYTYFQYNFSYEYYKSLNNHTSFLGLEEFMSGRDRPTILHFIGTWYERPWFKYNICPYKRAYVAYWKKCFPGSRTFDVPKLSLRNLAYDYTSLVIYKSFGLRAYFVFKYRVVQLIKSLFF